MWKTVLTITYNKLKYTDHLNEEGPIKSIFIILTLKGGDGEREAGDKPPLEYYYF